MAGRIADAIRQCSRDEVDEFALDAETVDDEEFITFDDDEFTYGIVDSITKTLHQLVEKIKCSVHVAGEAIGESELKAVFLKFKKDVTKLLNKDAKACLKTEGLMAKIE